MERVSMTAEALIEARELLRQEGLDGIDPARKVLRIAVGSCGLKRPVASPALAEPGDDLFEYSGIPMAIASTMAGSFHIGVGRGRFGAWLIVEAR